MRRLGADDLFWILVAGYAVTYNVLFAPEGRTLSEAWDRYLTRWPWMRLVIRCLARHLANELDPRTDPISIAFVVARSAVGRTRSAKPLVIVG